MRGSGWQLVLRKVQNQVSQSCFSVGFLKVGFLKIGFLIIAVHRKSFPSEAPCPPGVEPHTSQTKMSYEMGFDSYIKEHPTICIEFSG